MNSASHAWMEDAAQIAAETFQRHGARISLGGEPTYVPDHPVGAEWNYSAVGPEKLPKARALAEHLIADALPGGTAFFTPGKQYPGEVNPRWALRILFSEGTESDGQSREIAKLPPLFQIARQVSRFCKVPGNWGKFHDPLHPENEVRALLLDHDETSWQSAPWQLKTRELVLVGADGPAGLRLPLAHLPAGVSRRALTLERHGSTLSIFFPPLLQGPFLELLNFFRTHLPASAPGNKKGCEIRYQGYLPPVLDPPWQVLGLASDPGVLEINLPPCESWQKYAWWIRTLDACAIKAGLRAWRTDRAEFPGGTGGGNHLLFGSPAGEPNCFYDRPAWLASILTYWQRHPSLSYLFTGDYVGASSQAPRPDESGISLRELELALADLRDTDSPPIPYFISENLRHLLVDSAGNPHRAEISLDKFHDPRHPAGLLGLIEFRAIESMPRPEWTNAVALLWFALAAMLLEKPEKRRMRHYGRSLHDRFFLPQILLGDLHSVLADLSRFGVALEKRFFQQIWEWKFPSLLTWECAGGGSLEIRKAHESWPLLAEMPDEGGTTSRFVDTSLRRIEISAPAGWSGSWTILVNGRILPLHPIEGGREIAGLRYRHANLYPSLHPRRPIQLPLHLSIAPGSGEKIGPVHAEFVLNGGQAKFQKIRSSRQRDLPRERAIIPPSFQGALTCDLRF